MVLVVGGEEVEDCAAEDTAGEVGEDEEVVGWHASVEAGDEVASTSMQRLPHNKIKQTSKQQNQIKKPNTKNKRSLIPNTKTKTQRQMP